MNGEQVLLETRPSWWNYFWYLVFGWLIVPLLMALWKRAGLALRVTPDKVILEKGVLSKETKEVFISDIRTIDIKQSLFQRIPLRRTVRGRRRARRWESPVPMGMPVPPIRCGLRWLCFT